MSRIHESGRGFRRAKSTLTCSATFALLFATTFAWPAVAAPRPLPDSIVIERLGTLPPQFSDRFITGLEDVRSGDDVHAQARRRLFLSPDGLHMAFALDLVTSRLMVIDGVSGKSYGDVSRGAFSEQGGHFAYFAGPSELAGPTLVLDGREILLGVRTSGPLTLSADGQHWAVVGRARAESTAPHFVVSDRGTGAPYDSIGPIALSWDGSRMGYVARQWERSIVVIDGVESPWCEEATTPLFDLTSRHVAYACRRGASWKVIVDGQESESFAQIELPSLRFSASGTKLGYIASVGELKAFFVNGEPGGLWGALVADSSCFSPDGSHTLYWAGPGGGSLRVNRDGRPRTMRETGCPGPFAISALGDHFAYSECTPGNSGYHVVHDSIAGPVFDRVTQLRLSRDGERIAYTAQMGNYQAAVVDGRAGPNFANVGESSFSADCRHEAHTGLIAQGRAVVVFDGRNGPEFEWIAPLRPAFLPDGRLRYLAVRQSELLRVTRVPRAGE